MLRNWRVIRSRVFLIAVAGIALTSGGCLAVAAGVAAGGAVGVGYVYFQGEVDRDYPASYTDTRAAVLTSLTELGMPLLKERYNPGSTNLDSRTRDDDSVEIALTTRTSDIPAEGLVTRVSVRVTTWGNHEISARLLDQISLHLAPLPVVGGGQPQPAPAVVPAGLPLTPVPVPSTPPLRAAGQPVETAAPPLLPR